MDVFVSGDTATFIRLATRTRFHLRMRPSWIERLPLLDGTKELSAIFGGDDEEERGRFRAFLGFLAERGVVVDGRDEEEGWRSGFDPEYASAMERQFSWLLDVAHGLDGAASAQRRLHDLRIAIVGVGAVGGWIARMLAMIGVRDLRLVDPAAVGPSDAARHAFPGGVAGEKKAPQAAAELRSWGPWMRTEAVERRVDPDTDLDGVLGGRDLVVNTGDEPYIGHLALLIGRWCVLHGVPFLSAGGFDAHLGSSADLIIPGVTPCADCVTAHFRKALANWRPIQHPVRDRTMGFGGCAPLAIFSAAQAVHQVLLWILGEGDAQGGRNELDAETYDLPRFTIPRNPECRVCGQPRRPSNEPTHP